MSQWTHVCGCIRYDALRMCILPGQSINDLKALLGNTVSFEDSEDKWEACNVPRGSEGSIQFSFWENPHRPSLAAYTVAIFGDLRDFGNDNVQQIKDWFERVTHNDLLIVRNAILEIEVEYCDEPIILRYESPKIE